MKRSAFFLSLLLTPVLTCQSLAQEATTPWVPTIQAPQYFAVRVADAVKSAAWYRAVFGLEELDRAAADDGSWEIVNLRNDRLFVEVIRDDGAEGAGRVRGFFKVGFRVPDVEAAADAVEKAGGERPRVVEMERHGLRLVQLRDPDGNVIQLSSPLGGDAE